MDLYEDHRRAFVQHSTMYKQDIEDDCVLLQNAFNVNKPNSMHIQHASCNGGGSKVPLFALSKAPRGTWVEPLASIKPLAAFPQREVNEYRMPMSQWQMNRNHTIEDSMETINRIVFHRKNGHVDEKIQTKDAHVQHSSINSNGAPLQSMDIRSTSSSPVYTDCDFSTHEDDISEKPLPWQDSLDPSPTNLADSIPNNEPIIAHVPSWVNNLSYSHITETGSPYVSPQTTVIPQVKHCHKTLYSLFPQIQDELDTNEQKSVNSSDYFPNPWAQTNFEECPQVSQKAVFRPEDVLVHSKHTEMAPEHHHMIIPISLDSDEDSNNNARLTEVASAPDFQHWRPIANPKQLDNSARLQSDDMLSELAFQEGIKSRVQQWLIQASDDEENDADEEDDGNDDGLDDAEILEHELDVEMFIKP